MRTQILRNLNPNKNGNKNTQLEHQQEQEPQHQHPVLKRCWPKSTEKIEDLAIRAFILWQRALDGLPPSGTGRYGPVRARRLVGTHPPRLYNAPRAAEDQSFAKMV
jgi:hypothetical protein